MKFDFTQDRRLMQAGPAPAGAAGTKGVTQQMIDSALYDYNVAKKANNSAKVTEATRKILELAQQGNLLDAASEGAGKLATTAIDLQTERARNRMAAAQQATMTDVQLQATRGGAVVDAQKGATNSIFQSLMIGPNMEQSLYSTAKIWGGIIDKFFHTHIAEWAEKKLAEIKYPTIDTAGISRVSTTITSDAGSDRLDKQTNDAITTLSQDQGQVNAMVGRMSAALTARNGGTAPAPAPKAPITIEQAQIAAADLKKSGDIKSDVDLSGAVTRAAATDGNAKNFSVIDLLNLATRVEAKAGKDAAQKVTAKLELNM